MPYRLSGTKLLLTLFHPSALRLRLLFHDTCRPRGVMPKQDYLGLTVSSLWRTGWQSYHTCIEQVQQTEGSTGLKDELRMHVGRLWRGPSNSCTVHTASTWVCIVERARSTTPFLASGHLDFGQSIALYSVRAEVRCCHLTTVTTISIAFVLFSSILRQSILARARQVHLRMRVKTETGCKKMQRSKLYWVSGGNRPVT